MLGPPLSSRQIPYLLLALGAPFVALGLLPALAVAGLLPPDFAAPLLTAVFLPLGGAYVASAGILFWKHAHLVPGTPEYEEYHRQKDWHVHVTQSSVALWLGLGTLLAGFVILGILEGPQGRCFKNAPHPCLYSLSPSTGWEFWGTVLQIAGPTELLGFGLWKLAEWRRGRARAEAVS